MGIIIYANTEQPIYGLKKICHLGLEQNYIMKLFFSVNEKNA